MASSFWSAWFHFLHPTPPSHSLDCGFFCEAFGESVIFPWEACPLHLSYPFRDANDDRIRFDFCYGSRKSNDREQVIHFKPDFAADLHFAFPFSDGGERLAISNTG